MALDLVQIVFSGPGLALLGGTLAAGMSGWGSARGVGHVGSVAAGVMSEKPELFGKLLILQALPGTQGIYGLLVWFFIMMKSGILSGNPTMTSITQFQGALFFAACIPMMLVGYGSAVHQGNVAADGVLMVAKKPDEVSKPIVLAAMVETFAILALLASLLAIMNIIK